MPPCVQGIAQGASHPAGTSGIRVAIFYGDTEETLKTKEVKCFDKATQKIRIRERSEDSNEPLSPLTMRLLNYSVQRSHSVKGRLQNQPTVRAQKPPRIRILWGSVFHLHNTNKSLGPSQGGRDGTPVLLLRFHAQGLSFVSGTDQESQHVSLTLA